MTAEHTALVTAEHVPLLWSSCVGFISSITVAFLLDATQELDKCMAVEKKKKKDSNISLPLSVISLRSVHFLGQGPGSICLR